MFRYIPFLFILTACSASTPSIPAANSVCYQAQSQKEYETYLKKARKLEPFRVKGKKYECVENATPVEAVCYLSKNKKEYAKLAKQQEANPGQPLKIGKKHYLCIQSVN